MPSAISVSAIIVGLGFAIRGVWVGVFAKKIAESGFEYPRVLLYAAPAIAAAALAFIAAFVGGSAAVVLLVAALALIAIQGVIQSVLQRRESRREEKQSLSA